MALGLAVLSAVAAHAGTGLGGPAVVAERFGAALTGGSVMLGIALLVVVVFIVPAGRRLRSPAVSAAAKDRTGIEVGDLRADAATASTGSLG